MRLGGDAMIEWDEHGDRVTDDTFLLLLNADAGMIPFVLPRSTPDTLWESVLDSAEPELREGERVIPGGETLEMVGRSFVVMRRRTGAHGGAPGG
jgi:glycogen operon protein